MPAVRSWSSVDPPVRHQVLLSVVGIDRIEGNARDAGKRVAETAPDEMLEALSAFLAPYRG